MAASRQYPTRRVELQGNSPVGKETLTVGDTAAPLGSVPDGATRAFITVETTDGEYIRFWVDGDTATATAGHRVGNDDVFVLDTADQLANFSAIRDSGNADDGTLQITYF